MNKKNLITWKDADQNLCTMAAAILDEASKDLRATFPAVHGKPLVNGKKADPGYAEENSDRTINSGTRAVAPDAISQILGSHENGPYFGDESNNFGLKQDEPAATCWWSFQNIVRWRLREARQAIHDNLYKRGDKPKTSIQASRNPVKRKQGSKFGRQPER